MPIHVKIEKRIYKEVGTVCVSLWGSSSSSIAATAAASLTFIMSESERRGGRHSPLPAYSTRRTGHGHNNWHHLAQLLLGREKRSSGEAAEPLLPGISRTVTQYLIKLQWENSQQVDYYGIFSTFPVSWSCSQSVSDTRTVHGKMHTRHSHRKFIKSG